MIFHAMNPYHMQAIMAAYSVIIMLILIKFYNPYEGICTSWRSGGQTNSHRLIEALPVGALFYYTFDGFFSLNENKRGKARQAALNFIKS